MISDKHKTIKLSINKKDIPIWVYGNPKNPPIFFIHGYFNAFSQYIGDLPVRYLMKDYFVIAFDLPGFGLSKDLSIDNMKFISEVQKQIINNKKMVLFGVSYGGLISFKYTFVNPRMVHSIIIAGTPMFYKLFNIYKLAIFLPKHKNKKVTKWIFEEFKFLNKNNLNKIKNPVLLYYNRSDFIANVWMGKKLDSLLPNSRLFLSKKQNHSWLLHRIDRNGFLREINRFLNDIV